MDLLHTFVRAGARALRPLILVAGLGLLALVAVTAVAAESPSPSAPAAGTAAASGSPTPSVSFLVGPAASPSGAVATAAPAAPPTAAASASATKNSCYDCHNSLNDQMHQIAQQWKSSVHAQAGITCAECHGGDPTSDQVTVAMSAAKGFIGKPDRSTTVGVCGTCHSNVEKMRPYNLPTDILTQYQSSVHGELLVSQKDTRVAICTDCHGVHDIKKASDPTSKVYPTNIPALCASCHADAKYMAPYGIPTNQYAVYQNSIHGQLLLKQQDVRAPSCVSCHGSHDAKPPTQANVIQVCGQCHSATLALYQQSLHSQIAVGPVCTTCHGYHDVVMPDESRFFHPKPPEIDCTTCHSPADQSLKLNYNHFTNDADRRCDTCHHPNSLLYSQAQAIDSAITKASDAYNAAEAKIQQAASEGMIVSDADVTLTQAKTSLLQARAAVHTTQLTAVAKFADAAVAKAGDAQKFADSALDESLFRREAMVVILFLLLVNVLALFLVRRRLSHDYPTG